MRIYLIDNARKHAPKIFPAGPNAECYATNYDRSTVPEFVDLLKNPKKPQEAYPTYPRVLFTNYVVVDKELFRSDAILNVCHPTRPDPLPSLTTLPGIKNGPTRTKCP